MNLEEIHSTMFAPFCHIGYYRGSTTNQNFYFILLSRDEITNYS
jgi:hypothetical protein